MKCKRHPEQGAFLVRKISNIEKSMKKKMCRGDTEVTSFQ